MTKCSVKYKIGVIGRKHISQRILNPQTCKFVAMAAENAPLVTFTFLRVFLAFQ